MKILIIAEKFNVAQKIAYYLSEGKSKTVRDGAQIYFHFENNNNEYFVMGLKGHVIELDYEKDLSHWNIETIKKLPKSRPVKIIKNKGIINTLKKLVKNIDLIIVATDYDREGELIGVEVLEALDAKNFKRAKFSTITRNEIKDSFENLIDVNFKLSDSAESRQYVDLAWGAALTRFLSIIAEHKGKSFLSVGRVQSPTLALIVDRERQILEFVPTPYWNIFADFKHSIKFTGSHVKNPFEKDPVDIFNSIKDEKKGTVKSFEKEERKIYPPIPFNTTDFLRESTKLGISVSNSMKIAEDLYMSGYISYPRTDNTVYPKALNLKTALTNIRGSEFDREISEILSQDKIIPSRGKVSTTDHPPIYPVKPAKKKSLKKSYWDVYELIVRRFLATLAPSAVTSNANAIIEIKSEDFSAKGLKIVSPGWSKYYPYIRIAEQDLPDLVPGELISVSDIKKEEKMTLPPPRYSQSSLLKEMERLKLGTKSTRPEIIEKLFTRGYIEGNPIRPTNLGFALVEALEKNKVDAVNPQMTEKLEMDMDQIVEGTVNKEKVIDDSNKMLAQVITELESKQDQIRSELKEAIRSDTIFGKCPKCGSDLILVKFKGGKFLKCSSTTCDFKTSLPKTGKIEITDQKCEICGSPLIKIIRKGQSVELRCINDKCEFNKKKDYIGKCPNCGKDLVVRQSKNGKRFIGCTGYPNCTVTYPLPQKGKITFTGENCPVCKAPLIVLDFGKSKRKVCVDYKCSYNKKSSDKSEKISNEN